MMMFMMMVWWWFQIVSPLRKRNSKGKKLFRNGNSKKQKQVTKTHRVWNRSLGKNEAKKFFVDKDKQINKHERTSKKVIVNGQKQGHFLTAIAV